MSPSSVARRFPVRTALSGPAAGAVGAATCGAPDRATEHHHARYGRHQCRRGPDPRILQGSTSPSTVSVAGFPIRMPMRRRGNRGCRRRLGRLVRPGRAAQGGADQRRRRSPGRPATANGGERPTVTDANLLLGRLSSRGLLDGDMGLILNCCRRAAYQPLADRLGFFGVERTAHGRLGIVVANMVRTIRTSPWSAVMIPATSF